MRAYCHGRTRVSADRDFAGTVVEPHLCKSDEQRLVLSLTLVVRRGYGVDRTSGQQQRHRHSASAAQRIQLSILRRLRIKSGTAAAASSSPAAMGERKKTVASPWERINERLRFDSSVGPKISPSRTGISG